MLTTSKLYFMCYNIAHKILKVITSILMAYCINWFSIDPFYIPQAIAKGYNEYFPYRLNNIYPSNGSQYFIIDLIYSNKKGYINYDA